jgi:transposase
MNKVKSVYVGIDVSKDTFNYHYSGKDGKCKNCRQGWQKLANEVPSNSVFGMEATGVYHYRLAAYLHSKGFLVRVFNPLRVNRFMQSEGIKTKTDKADARSICLYSQTRKARVYVWKPLPPKLARARSIVTVLAALSRFGVASGNVNHSVSYMAGKDKSLLSPLENVKRACKKERKSLEKELCQIVSEVYPERFKLLKSIRGIGAYTAAVMLVCAKGLNFDTSGQLSSFIGVVPGIKESGTSVKGKPKLVKTGNPYLRGLFYMCAFAAVKCNAACRSLYERLLAKGKKKPLAHTAVMHRLVKIAFGVVQSGEPCRIGKPV